MTADSLPDFPTWTDAQWPLSLGLAPERRIGGPPLDFGPHRMPPLALNDVGTLVFEEEWLALVDTGSMALALGVDVPGHQHEPVGRSAEERIASIPAVPERGWEIHEVDGLKVHASAGPFPIDGIDPRTPGWGEESDPCYLGGWRCASCPTCPYNPALSPFERAAAIASRDWSAGLEDEV